ncbi:MAG TPA: NAD(P)H-binding protein [Stellaceae bacterium]|nr:NAD(P)H-binding protein [Stellaceae bacterium]
MRVLLTGANGFIGRYLLTALRDAGHEVIAAVRRPVEITRAFPRVQAIAIDLNRDVTPEIWRQRVAGIDAVINCAGILQSSSAQSISAIHHAGPTALFDACAAAGVRRVIQISAISADPAARTDYAVTKRAADDHLAALDIDWVVLRPSLVYASGSYGGTSLFRALAAFPFVIPVPGEGRQLFQPIHIGDLAATVLRILAEPSIRRITIDPVGPEPLMLRDIVMALRRWLGLPTARVLPIPRAVVRLAARIGDLLGGPLNTTALHQMEYGNTGSVERFTALTGLRPRSFAAALERAPAQVQDRWHARLYFVRPLLRFTLATLWLGSGLVGLVVPISSSAAELLAVASPAFRTLLVWLSCGLDIAVGVALVARWRPRVTAGVQIGAIVTYTAILSLLRPALWLDPFGPLLKNLPIIAAVLALGAIENDR